MTRVSLRLVGDGFIWVTDLRKTLHKTAEIYGAPDAVGHTLRHVDAMTSLMGRRVISWTTRLDV